jgi:tetratricopeptide (TPR) repeat protein
MNFFLPIQSAGKHFRLLRLIPRCIGLSLLIPAVVSLQALGADIASNPALAPAAAAPASPAVASFEAPSTSDASNPDSTSSSVPPSDDQAAPAPEPGEMPTPGVSKKAPSVEDQALAFQAQFDLARKLRGEKDSVEAEQILTTLLASTASSEIKRRSLFELALASQDENHLPKAGQIFAQYLHLYPDDPTTPEVLLRQGIIYRQMGVPSLAISKFYSVMSTSLKLKLENLDYYKKLVLQAQIEIADTYYLQGRYSESSDYFSRLLKDPPPDLDQAQIQYKLIRSLSALTNSDDTIAHAQVFLDVYTNSSDVPEVRFLLAAALKQLGRNQEALKQVLLLLQSQRENLDKNPELWAYWQRRAGSEISAQLCKEGDYLDALQINLSLADLDKSAAWQLPVWYKTALIYEQLGQWQRASDTYQRILDRRNELAGSDASPGLISLSDMAKWRKDYLAWLEKAQIANLTYERSATNSPPAGVAATP